MLSPVKVAVAEIIADPATTVADKLRYRIVLVCGCSWWEERHADDGPPSMTTASCYSSHIGPADTRIKLFSSLRRID